MIAIVIAENVSTQMHRLQHNFLPFIIGMYKQDTLAIFFVFICCIFWGILTCEFVEHTNRLIYAYSQLLLLFGKISLGVYS